MVLPVSLKLAILRIFPQGSCSRCQCYSWCKSYLDGFQVQYEVSSMPVTVVSNYCGPMARRSHRHVKLVNPIQPFFIKNFFLLGNIGHVLSDLQGHQSQLDQRSQQSVCKSCLFREATFMTTTDAKKYVN